MYMKENCFVGSTIGGEENMTTTKIIVRKETVRCDMCKRLNNFLYLSDFAYGQRLVYFNNTTELAFINLLEDKVFLKYGEMAKELLNRNRVAYTSDEVDKFVNKSFGVTCDSLYGMNIDFSIGQEKCLYCGSSRFERNKIEPESMTEIVVPVISHDKWETLDENQKKEIIFTELKREGLV